MRLSISNIAWDVAEDDAVAKLLERYAIDAIDIAPGKYFSEPSKTSDQEISAVRNWWHDKGVAIVGMQALLFGTTGLNLFGTEKSRLSMLAHFNAVCRIGANLGATFLVFGSPKNRDRTGMSDQQAEEIAIPFFKQLGDIAKMWGVSICLEPNPTHYGANFMTCSDDTANIVRRVNHPAIMMQFDTGALKINGENPEDILAKHSELISHVHASEPDLLPLGDGGTDHVGIANALANTLAERVVTIEMLATKEEPHLTSIERALVTALNSYGKVTTRSIP